MIDESLQQVLDDSCCIILYIWYIVGIAYVTYSKASEAALAIEKMNGQTVKGGSRHVKVGQLSSSSSSSFIITWYLMFYL